MIYRLFAILCIGLCVMACNDAEYRECNDLISSCSGNEQADYCLFGYKWGDDPFFVSTGRGASGPGTGAGVITYSFNTEEELINTHSENDIIAISFDRIIDCGRDEVRSAFEQFSSVANISFEEVADNTESDLTFRAAFLSRQSAIGYPNYSHGRCQEIAGNILFTPNEFRDCHSFYIVALHEIGHALGLGHVSSNNIMTPGGDKFDYNGLQAGDIMGIVSIYGSR